MTLGCDDRVCRLMIPRVSHSLFLSLCLSRLQCVSLTTPWAWGCSATYNTSTHFYVPQPNSSSEWSARPVVKRAPFLPPLYSLAARFSVFLFSCCLLSLSLPRSSRCLSYFLFLLFHSLDRERGRPREITRPPWAPARPSRAQCSLLSQFANRAPGPRIVHLHFTIFRSEINTAPSAPHHKRPFIHDISLFFLSFSLLCSGTDFLVSCRSTSGPIPAAQPTDLENRRRGCRLCKISREAWKLMHVRLSLPSIDRSIVTTVNN